MRTVPPGWGAGMRWAVWLLLGAVACGGGHAVSADPDAGVGSVVVPSDAGTGGVDAGPSADCAGLVPASIGQAYAVDVTTATATDVCAFTTSDGHGVIATQTGGGSWGEYTSSAKTGSFSTATPQIVPQSAGFVGLYSNSSGVVVAEFDEGGVFAHVATGGQTGMIALAPVDGDGILVFTGDASGLTARKLDGSLVETGSATVAGTFVPRSGAQDASGAVLALIGSGNAVSGIWIDLARGTAGAPFAIGTGTQIAAVPLLGGGVAIQLDGHWAALLEPGQSTLHPAPAWLRDGAQLAVVRGGAAYALVPATGDGIDIVSPQGNACGTVTFPGANTLALGRGGAVIGSTGARSCTKIFWQNALR